MNPAILNLVVTLGLMQLARKIPFENEEVLLGLRGAYILSQIIQFGIYYFINMQIKKKNDTSTLKYVGPPAMGSSEPGELVTTTVRDYDLQETSKSMRSVMMGMAMIGFMHLYMKYTQPLFIQSIMPLKTLWDNPMVKLHVRGQPATGDLARPFKAAPSMFGGAGGPVTDKAAIVEAEKRSGATKKEL